MTLSIKKSSGPRQPFRSDRVAGMAGFTDECDAEGWSLTVEGTLVDAGSELAGNPIIVPNSICRRGEARPTK